MARTASPAVAAAGAAAVALKLVHSSMTVRATAAEAGVPAVLEVAPAAVARQEADLSASTSSTPP